LPAESLKGAGPSVAAQSDRTMFRFRGCEGPQPSKSITACEALIQTWKAPVPRRRPIRLDNVPLPRLQGTAALQTQ